MYGPNRYVLCMLLAPVLTSPVQVTSPKCELISESVVTEIKKKMGKEFFGLRLQASHYKSMGHSPTHHPTTDNF